MTASDCHPLAAEFLAENLRLNHLTPMKYRHGHWTQSSHDDAPGPQHAPGREALAHGVVHGHYDFIIGSDLLYERDPDGMLAAFIDRHAGASAEVWIVDPDRGNRSAFNRHMASQGFCVHEERLDLRSSAVAAAYKGRLMAYRRGAAAA